MSAPWCRTALFVPVPGACRAHGFGTWRQLQWAGGAMARQRILAQHQRAGCVDVQPRTSTRCKRNWDHSAPYMPGPCRARAGGHVLTGYREVCVGQALPSSPCSHSCRMLAIGMSREPPGGSSEARWLHGASVLCAGASAEMLPPADGAAQGAEVRQARGPTFRRMVFKLPVVSAVFPQSSGTPAIKTSCSFPLPSPADPLLMPRLRARVVFSGRPRPSSLTRQKMP